MEKITAIRAGRGRGKRMNLFLDGRFALSLEADVAVKENLRTGQELSAEELAALTKANCFQRCLNAAGSYLGYRPRSESEMRQRLYRRGFDEASVAAVISRLKEQGLIDDSAFAQFWKENRESFRPRSQWLTRSELRQKGITEDIIDGVVSGVDDNDSACRAARSKARSLSRADYQEFRRRLGGYLRRRGFTYEIINNTVERIWQEMDSNLS
ncbi:RecX family transcriptional regulator [Chloroflexota bacterium]